MSTKKVNSTESMVTKGIVSIVSSKIVTGDFNPRYDQIVNLAGGQTEAGEMHDFIKNLCSRTKTTPFQCYRREFVKGEKAGTKPAFEFGDNATSEMLVDGSGYYITDPDNGLQYFVNMKQASETGK